MKRSLAATCFYLKLCLAIVLPYSSALSQTGTATAPIVALGTVGGALRLLKIDPAASWVTTKPLLNFPNLAGLSGNFSGLLRTSHAKASFLIAKDGQSDQAIWSIDTNSGKHSRILDLPGFVYLYASFIHSINAYLVVDLYKQLQILDALTGNIVNLSLSLPPSASSFSGALRLAFDENTWQLYYFEFGQISKLDLLSGVVSPVLMFSPQYPPSNIRVDSATGDLIATQSDALGNITIVRISNGSTYLISTVPSNYKMAGLKDGSQSLLGSRYIIAAAPDGLSKACTDLLVADISSGAFYVMQLNSPLRCKTNNATNVVYVGDPH